jgi:hypothetical protein
VSAKARPSDNAARALALIAKLRADAHHLCDGLPSFMTAAVANRAFSALELEGRFIEGKGEAARQYVCRA